jgi:peroxiredoxin family protein
MNGRGKMCFLSVAASVAVAIGIGVTVLATWHRSSMGDRMEAVVYINGTRVTDDAYARAIAEKRQECIAMMMEVVAESELQQREFSAQLQKAERLRKQVSLN